MKRGLRLAVIVGSTREARFGSTVARWFTTQAEARAEFARVEALAPPNLRELQIRFERKLR